MIEIESQAREWGNSIGIVIPRDAVIREKIKPGDFVKLLLKKKQNPLKETFGILKLKRATKDILKEVDEESWNG